MDPQQRLLLEAFYEAAAPRGGAGAGAAGAGALASECGVYIGISAVDYSKLAARLALPITAYSATGSLSLSVAAGRLSYTFGLRGPALAVDTACSSSLVAAHAAAAALRLGHCGAAAAGGVNLTLIPDTPAMFQRAGMLSPDGRCKTLDAAADGYVRAEAVGVMLLQPLAGGGSAAPLALLAGAAVNQDGRSSGLTAPNGPAQQDVVRAALDSAGLSPGDVTGVSMHGTGTPLGDPIEVGALAAVFGGASRSGSAPAPLVLSASKSWLGHAEPAAGMVGLLQAARQVSGAEAPPIGHLRTLNPLVASALGDRGARGGRVWTLPRQAGGAGSPEAVALARVGVSAFAFQVGLGGFEGSVGSRRVPFTPLGHCTGAAFPLCSQCSAWNCDTEA
ncbi:MAG: thiolase-like protein [Monoraphidium minutum]|nr:MAG: thiolase-like protein [Monoraphidium minutum]